MKHEYYLFLYNLQRTITRFKKKCNLDYSRNLEKQERYLRELINGNID